MMLEDILLPLLIACVFWIALVAPIIWYARRQFWRLNVRLNRMESYVWETAALQGLVAGHPVMPRPGGWAVSTDVLYELARMVHVDQPKLVVELGSGLSTVVLAAALAKHGGRLISIDHDPHYARRTLDELCQRGLQNYAEIRVSPIKTQELDGMM